MILRTKIKVSHLLISKHITKLLESKLYDTDIETHAQPWIPELKEKKKRQVNSWIQGEMKFTKVLRQQNRKQ